MKYFTGSIYILLVVRISEEDIKITAKNASHSRIKIISTKINIMIDFMWFPYAENIL